jgi:dTDP-4-amino-4,6-dideoxygalactose transaminase
VIPHSRSTAGAREAAAAARAVRSPHADEKEVAAFESAAARFLGLAGGAAAGSGATALGLGLRALGAGPGKEVIVPAYARPAVLHAVRLSGAEPVPADVHWHDMNLSAAQARRRLTHRTVAVVAVHSFGAPVELEAFLKLGVPLVEELSHAFGGVDYNRRKLGTFGAFAVASFSDGGLLCTGEGGMVLSNDARILDAVRGLRSCGDGPADVLRLDARMTGAQAAVGRVQLARLPGFLSARRRWADGYREALRGSGWEPSLQIYGRVYGRFVVKSPRPVTEALLSSLAKAGVEIRRPVLRPLHWDMPAAGPFPVSERVWRRALSLPFHPALREAELRKVAAVLRQAG